MCPSRGVSGIIRAARFSYSKRMSFIREGTSRSRMRTRNTFLEKPKGRQVSNGDGGAHINTSHVTHKTFCCGDDGLDHVHTCNTHTHTHPPTHTHTHPPTHTSFLFNLNIFLFRYLHAAVLGHRPQGTHTMRADFPIGSFLPQWKEPQCTTAHKLTNYVHVLVGLYNAIRFHLQTRKTVHFRCCCIAVDGLCFPSFLLFVSSLPKHLLLHTHSHRQLNHYKGPHPYLLRPRKPI